ncbi:25S rRNA (cytosine-C(5))-methyltransferase NSUN5-like [Malus sylvestris]|uniref:25S rRNA (cytosine-C(5))-methyltransferase NSUN5-like n=1 Tax=Malus sylvestris TaxID=3752 RepID=UPI0021ABB693|nr:25S rRNA (cytosine-C(5))-methyltransferase NSUN5-like [Malus sylvestris]
MDGSIVMQKNCLNREGSIYLLFVIYGFIICLTGKGKLYGGRSPRSKTRMGGSLCELGSWKQNCTPFSSNERKKGNVIACELNEERVRRLKETIGLSDIKVVDGVFLDLNPEDPQYSKVRAILLEHSCSASGTASARLDHLLPSSAPVPEVESFVHSTCSVNQVKNEDVIKSVLPLAASHGFQLETAFPKWHRHSLPSVEGGKWHPQILTKRDKNVETLVSQSLVFSCLAAECMVRTDPKEDKEGFFIALVTNQRHLTEPMEPAF